MPTTILKPALVAAALSATLTGVALAGPADDPANWRKVDPENILMLTIKRQDVLIELRPDFAPNHVAQVKKIARDGNYNMLPFHRVIDDFMAQGGEVSAIYMLSTPYPAIKAEFTFQRDPAKQKVEWLDNGSQPTGLLDGFVVTGQPDAAGALMADKSVTTWAKHCPGITSMARTDQPNSADTQFFLMRQTRNQLDANYTIWGRALTGLDVIRGIKAGPDSTDGRLPPAEADKLSKAQIVADIAEYKRPTVYVQRIDGPAYAEALANARAGGAQSACDLPPVPVVVEIPTLE
jgi:peptidylprolyl isomerase